MIEDEKKKIEKYYSLAMKTIVGKNNAAVVSSNFRDKIPNNTIMKH